MIAAGWWLGLRPTGRAELDAIFAFYPLALLLLSTLVAGQPLRMRAGVIAAGLLLAGTGGMVLVTLLGAPVPLGQALRGVAAGAGLALLLDLAHRLGRAAGGRAGPGLGAVAALAVLLAPGPVPLFRRAVLTPEPPLAAARPKVALLTGLPLAWDEAGVAGTLAGGEGGGGAALRVLRQRFAIRPMAAAAALDGARLALIAQPRPPGPAGLVALDAWLRHGGRALILVDPALRWPTALPLGDPRRPPDASGMTPLLAHLGVRLSPGGDGLAVRDVAAGGPVRRVALVSPGRLDGCGAAKALWIDCRIGAGRAVILADADLLADRAWIGDGPAAATRAGRLADNPQLLADLLDRLAGRAADAGDRVRWAGQADSAD